MLINYSHKVDIPVTDLDDDEDDILFNQQMNVHVGLGGENLEFNEPVPSLWQKFVGYFKTSYKRLETYELRNVNSFEINDSDEASYEIRDNLKQPPTRKEWKYKSIIALLSICLLISVGILFKRQSHPVNSWQTKVLLSNSTHNFYPTTIIVSLDGFHPHYISPKVTPALHDMMTNQYGAPFMIPSFPSSTFPNHWTLVTGLYPSEHGIVGNTFYDPKLHKQFVNTDPKQGGLDPDFWKGGEPIWKTAFNQGVKSAVHMWPGSEVQGVGINNGPLEVDRYNGSEVLSSKVDRVMSWLDNDINQRPELILTYVPTIDLYGHKYGISGDELLKALAYVDDFVNLLRKEINSRNLSDIVNLIFVSDHGMAPTSNDRLLYLDDIIDLKKIEHIDGWPLFGLRPFKEFSVDDIFKELNDNFNQLDASISKNFNIYRKETIPKEFNFGHKSHKYDYRLAPIWIIPKVGYSITTHEQMNNNNNQYTPKGVHGYNNTELLMRALFVGEGPYFKNILHSKYVKPFANTEVYNIICKTLNLSPAPNNGSSSVIDDSHALPDDWKDPLYYPNLDYQVDHIVGDATYDLLWKPHDPDQGIKTIYYSQNPSPKESINQQESSLKTVDISLPKPSDFTKPPESNTSEKPKHDLPTLSDKQNLFDDIFAVGEDIIDGIEDLGHSFGHMVGDLFDHDD